MKLGHAKAFYFLANLYLSDKGGIKVDSLVRAWFLLQSKVNAGAAYNFVWAMTVLVSKQKDEQKYQKFTALIRYAAERGSYYAQYEIGQMYQKGSYNITRDVNNALKWYQKAALQGHINQSIK